MKIALGQKGDYAVRAALALAYGGRRKAREIAAEMKIPEGFLPQILGDLIRAGFVTSVAGPDGGYSLSKRPREVSLLDVIEAAEGPVKSEKCVLRGGPCHWDHACAVHWAWSDAQGALVERLRRVSLARLVRDDVRASRTEVGPRNGVAAPAAPSRADPGGAAGLA